MAYLDRSARPVRREGLIAAGLLHVALGYAFVTGLVGTPFQGDPPPPPIRVVTVPKVAPPPPPPDPEFRPERIEPRAYTPDIIIKRPPAPDVTPLDWPERLPLPPQGDVGRADPAPPSPPAKRADPPAPPAPSRIAARASGRNVIDSDDYPDAARRAGEEGIARARYTITTEGRATGCSIVASSGHARLDAATCAKIERRFRFEPAREGDLAVEETRTQAVRWRLTE